MSKPAIRPTIKVTIGIRTGPVTPHMRACWNKWWAARIAEVKQESTK